MYPSSETIIHSTNGTPFALELVADHTTAEGQTYQGITLNYNSLLFRLTGSAGLEGRVAKRIPLEFRWAKHINGCGRSWLGFGTIPSGEERYINLKYNNEIGSCWDRNYFLVATRRYSQKPLIESFFKSFQEQDMALWLSHGQFSLTNKVSLILAIKSKIPASLANEMKTYDDNLPIWRTDRKFTELTAKLSKAGRAYNNLHVVNKKANGELIYWLNVYDARNNNSGLYDQFEMDAWVNNLGPIVKGAPPLVRPVPIVATTAATTIVTPVTPTQLTTNTIATTAPNPVPAPPATATFRIPPTPRFRWGQRW